MKQILIFFLFPAALSAQVEIKDVSVQKIGGVDYYVTADTVDGAINLVLSPVVDKAKLLDAEIEEVQNLIASYQIRIEEMQDARKSAQRRLKELEKIKQSLLKNRK